VGKVMIGQLIFGLDLGDYLLADHLVENILRARLERGTWDLIKDSPQLDQATVDEYDDILAKVSLCTFSPR